MSINFLLDSVSEVLKPSSLSERAKRRALRIADDLDARMLPPRKPSNGGNGSARVPGHPTGSAEWPLAPGLILTREYRGQIHQVAVLAKGFEYDGQVYRSLSAIARAISGTNWNGKLFFGLKKRGKANGK